MSDLEQEVQTITESGRPAPRRISTPTAAYSLYQSYYDAAIDESTRCATIQGMIDGNPPYDPKEMEEQGRSGDTNVNFMSMRANLDIRASAAHEMFMEVPTLIDLYPRLPDPTDQFMNDYCRIIAEEFTELTLAWPGFQTAMDLAFRESDAYGIGFCLWPDKETWKPQAYKRGSLLFDPMAKVNLCDNDVYMIRDTLDAGALLEKTERPDVARDEGWKISSISDTLKRIFLGDEAADGTDKYQRSTLESLQQMKRNNDPDFESKQFQKVKIVHILCREVTKGRKWSHMIIPDSSSNQVFLYESAECYDKIDQVMWWLPFNYGDGYARGVRGVASWMAQHDDLSNRSLCRAFDAGLMSSSLLVQPTSNLDLGRLQFVQQGAITIVPSELKISQSTFQPQIGQVIQLRELSENVMKNNTGMSRQNPETFNDGGAPKTARQVAEESSKEARMEKAAVSHRYNHLEYLYREMFRRVVALGLLPESEVPVDGDEEARNFIQRCTDRKVPRELLKNHDKKLLLRATRAIGMGSLGVRMDLTNQFMQARGMLDTEGQMNVLRDWFAARAGQRNVDRYIRPYNRDLNPSQEHSFVALENNDLSQAQQVVVGADQLHRIHVLGHAQFVSPILQAVQQGQIQDPVKAYQVITVSGQHIGGHAQYLAQDAGQKEFMEQLKPLFKAMEEAVRMLEQMIKQMQAQQQKQLQDQQGKLAEADSIIAKNQLEAQIYEINKKYEMEGLKQQSLNQMRAEKTQAQMEISRERAAADIQLKAQRQAAEIDLDRTAQALKST